MSQLLLALLEVGSLKSLSDPRDVSATFGTFGSWTLLGSRLFVGCPSYFGHFWKLGPSKAIVTHVADFFFLKEPSLFSIWSFLEDLRNRGMSQLLLALLQNRSMLDP